LLYFDLDFIIVVFTILFFSPYFVLLILSWFQYYTLTLINNHFIFHPFVSSTHFLLSSPSFCFHYILKFTSSLYFWLFCEFKNSCVVHSTHQPIDFDLDCSTKFQNCEYHEYITKVTCRCAIMVVGFDNIGGEILKFLGGIGIILTI
jgi:hypothetical protein